VSGNSGVLAAWGNKGIFPPYWSYYIHIDSTDVAAALNGRFGFVIRKKNYQPASSKSI